jgi:hypothetical protein
VAVAEPAPSRFVDPNAIQKPNRSGKGGKLAVEPRAEASSGGQSPAASNIALGFSGSGASSAQ